MKKLKPGFYWVRRTNAHQISGSPWTVARYDGSDTLPWTLMGSDCLFETAELFEPDDEGGIYFELGNQLVPPQVKS